MNALTRSALRDSMRLAARGILEVEALARCRGRGDELAWFEMRLLLLRSRLGAQVTGPSFLRDVRSFALSLEVFVGELAAD